MSVRDHAAVEAANRWLQPSGRRLSRSHLAALRSVSSWRAHAWLPEQMGAAGGQVAVPDEPGSVGVVLDSRSRATSTRSWRAGSLVLRLGLVIESLAVPGKSCSCWATARCSSSCTCFRLAVHDQRRRRRLACRRMSMFQAIYWPERPDMKQKRNGARREPRVLDNQQRRLRAAVDRRSAPSSGASGGRGPLTDDPHSNMTAPNAASHGATQKLRCDMHAGLLPRANANPTARTTENAQSD